MKNLKKKLIIPCTLFSLLLINTGNFVANAQVQRGEKVVRVEKWEEINWDTYLLKFSLPESVKEVQNTRDRYIAESETITFEIYPWKDSSLTEEDVALQAYIDLGLDFGSDKNITKEKRNLNGFSGYEIMGEGKYRGREVYFAVLGFIDPQNSNNFAAYITFWKDEKNKEELFKIERKIIESIEAK